MAEIPVIQNSGCASETARSNEAVWIPFRVDAEASTLFLVARIHADHRATEIGERDLLPTEPWLTTYQRASREFELIDYALARPLTPDPIPRHWMAMPAAGYRRGV